MGAEDTFMRPITVQIVGTTGGFSAGIDGATASMQVIDYAHHEIHDGNVYCLTHVGTEGNTDVVEITLKTPNTTEWFHMLANFRATGEGNFTIVEAVTRDSGGAAAIPVNHNRNSSNTSSATGVFKGATSANPISYSAAGTVIWREDFGSVRSPSESRALNEWVLKQNTEYVFRMTSEEAANEMWLGLVWYEHTDKE
jgi:hypothetical protein